MKQKQLRTSYKTEKYALDSFVVTILESDQDLFIEGNSVIVILFFLRTLTLYRRLSLTFCHSWILKVIASIKDSIISHILK
jgi:hypothetical protein